MENLKFENMNLSPDILNAIYDMGFEEATPIQNESINVIMSGKDVIGQSQTGTGKTAAFGIPCIERIDPDDRRVQAIILCPTRELAIQVSEEFRKLLKYRENIRVLPVYGGQPIDRQIFALKKGAHIIIGTPGRVMDHMQRKTIRLDAVKMAILDEADEMLDMGFREDIETILRKTPDDRQTILFSATLPQDILDLANNYQYSPEFIKVVRKELTVPSIEQVYFEVKEKTKLDAVCRIIDMYTPGLTLIFCNTKKRVDDLVEQLQGRGYFAEGLHGDLKQQQRDKVMSKFRNATIEILVATDVAARGIDVDDIDIVFNYDIPQDEEYYVHRIGRTGRAGKAGKAYTFVVGKEIYKLRDIMKYSKAKIIPQKLPTLSDIGEVKSRTFIDKIKSVINEGHLSKYVNMVENLVEEDYATMDIASALMKIAFNYDDEKTDFVEELESQLTKEYEYRTSKTDRNKWDDKKPSDLEKKKFKKSDKDKMTRLFINVGKKDKVRAKDILGAIAGETGMPGKFIGAIDIFEEYTFVDVPKKDAKDVLTKMKNIRIKGNKINIEPAKGGK